MSSKRTKPKGNPRNSKDVDALAVEDVSPTSSKSTLHSEEDPDLTEERPDAGAVYDKDDTTYRGQPINNRVMTSGHHQRPVTRNSAEASINKGHQNMDAVDPDDAVIRSKRPLSPTLPDAPDPDGPSPSKHAKLDTVDSKGPREDLLDDASEKSNQRTRLSKDNEVAEDSAPTNGTPGKEKAIVAETETFASAMVRLGRAPEASKHASIFLEDQEKYTVKSLPDVCEVTDPEVQDPVLAATGDYENLPNLRKGRIIPSKNSQDAEGPGHILFESWHAICGDDLIYSNALGALRFVQSGRVINPSRISPLLVSARQFELDNSRLRLYVGSRFAICVTSVCVTSSFLRRLAPKINQKQLRGITHCQEWERMEGFFSMVFDKPVMRCGVYRDSISFGTKGTSGSSGTPLASSAFRSSPKKSDNDASGSGTTDTATDSATATKFLLDATDSIPVYDARQTVVDYDVDLLDPKKKFPLFHSEVPTNSFALVAYSAIAQRGKDRDWWFNANIQWVLLLGTPIGGYVDD